MSNEDKTLWVRGKNGCWINFSVTIFMEVRERHKSYEGDLPPFYVQARVYDTNEAIGDFETREEAQTYLDSLVKKNANWANGVGY